MSRKNTLVHQLESSKSLATSFITDPTVILHHDNCVYQINVTTSDSKGYFVVQASMDYSVDGPTNTVKSAGSWVDLVLAGGTPIVNAANDTILIDLNQLSFYAIRLSYVSTTAGTGTCSVYVGARQIGG